MGLDLDLSAMTLLAHKNVDSHHVDPPKRRTWPSLRPATPLRPDGGTDEDPVLGPGWRYLDNGLAAWVGDAESLAYYENINDPTWLAVDAGSGSDVDIKEDSDVDIDEDSDVSIDKDLVFPWGDAFQATHEGLMHGQTVKFCDLKARAELNGKRGKLVRYDVSAGRWHVRIKQETVKARPANLRAEDVSQGSGGNVLDWGDVASLDDILCDLYDE